MQQSNLKTKELLAVLDNNDGERALCEFLVINPYVLLESLRYIGNPTRIIAQFPLGNDFISDFVVIAPFSGAFEIKFIEIEPPKSPFFNQNGSLSQRANKALEQVNSWKTYITKNRPQLLRDLKRYANEKDLIRKHNVDDALTCSAGIEIHHPQIALYFTFDIIMSRRSLLDARDLEKKAEFKNNNDVSLISCDRLLQGAERIDRNPQIY
ncbi:Shedu anti-phage system protein SduA domain-containing protein [Rariglobus hedericola]|uniref:DUF4263 domain-containing protein n=1 Tax=Rariglobus hedericola TaxID=2597822 RepID=A0A556QDI8_9BACT|nr:Shedu anti-phage system protein SduA domain-containing protein [Rariglobus hedericola]TSJ74723.1 DUF4263 domain-containing protein [Rariglobus hedericola]